LENHSELAKELFTKGYNCSQSVFAAFCDETGMDLETALKLSSSLGGGMGGLREVCGAVSGMFMAAGMLYGYSDPEDKTAKEQHYELLQALAAKFREENCSIICRELLGLQCGADSPTPKDRRLCSEFVEHAAEILDEYIRNNPPKGGTV